MISRHPREAEGSGDGRRGGPPRKEPSWNAQHRSAGAEVTSTDHEFLTVLEVAEFLRVTPSTIYRLSARGVLKGMRVGHEYRFSVRELDRWLS